MTQFPLEAGLTASLWDLFASEGPVELALRCLYRQLPAEDDRVKHFKKTIAVTKSLAWWPRRVPGPDLAITTPENEKGVSQLLAVIEIKAKAPTNWPMLSSATALPKLQGAIASTIHGAYLASELNEGANICQSDLYRSRVWWRDSDSIEIPNPEEVLWLLFDTQGRQSSEVFKDSAAADAWLSIDLKIFAANLREMRSGAPLTAAHHDTIAVVLWHIDQSPGENITTTTTDLPRRKDAPNTDQIEQLDN